MEKIEMVELAVLVFSFSIVFYALNRMHLLPKLKLSSRKLGNTGAFEVNRITNRTYAEIKGLNEK